jgi:hypothetical protein
MTAAAEDRCWNCGVVPERWIDVTSPQLEDERLLCSNCFAATTQPRIYLRLDSVAVAGLGR